MGDLKKALDHNIDHRKFNNDIGISVSDELGLYGLYSGTYSSK